MSRPLTPRFSDTPGFDEVLAALLKAGCPRVNRPAFLDQSIAQGLNAGMPPALLAAHFIGIVKKHQGGAWNGGDTHGSQWRIPKKRVPQLMRGIGVGDIAWE